MKLDKQSNSVGVLSQANVTKGARNLLRETFSRSVERGDYPTAWSLRVGFVELIQQDTYRILGYKADRIDSFLGLPITMCPSGSRNQLITATGSISIPELEAIWRTQSYAND